MAASSIGRDIHLVRTAQIAGEAFGHDALQDGAGIRSAASVRLMSILMLLLTMCAAVAVYLVA